MLVLVKLCFVARVRSVTVLGSSCVLCAWRDYWLAVSHVKLLQNDLYVPGVGLLLDSAWCPPKNSVEYAHFFALSLVWP